MTEAPAAPEGSQSAPDATPAGAYAYFTGSDGSIAWLDLPASYDEPAEGYLRPVAADPSTTVRFEDPKAWSAEVDKRGLTETPVPVNGDPASDQEDPDGVPTD